MFASKGFTAKAVNAEENLGSAVDALLDRLVYDELKNASNFTTRSTIKLRVFFKFAERLDISRDAIYNTKEKIQIDPSALKVFENLWNGHSGISAFTQKEQLTCFASPLTRGDEMSADECMTMELFLSRDFAKPSDVSRVVNVLKKKKNCLQTQRPPSDALDSEESAIKDFWCLFAVDGLLNDADDPGKERLDPYFVNLSHPVAFGERNDFRLKQHPSEIHARAVRTLYRDVEYATPVRIASALAREYLGEETVSEIKLGSRRECYSSDSDDSDEMYSERGSYASSYVDDSDEEEDAYLLAAYKRVVGVHIEAVVPWLRERCRIRQQQKENRSRSNGRDKRVSGRNAKLGKNLRRSPVTPKTQVQKNAERIIVKVGSASRGARDELSEEVNCMPRSVTVTKVKSTLARRNDSNKTAQLVKINDIDNDKNKKSSKGKRCVSVKLPAPKKIKIQQVETTLPTEKEISEKQESVSGGFHEQEPGAV